VILIPFAIIAFSITVISHAIIIIIGYTIVIVGTSAIAVATGVIAEGAYPLMIHPIVGYASTVRCIYANSAGQHYGTS
jgi:hypothetical protein